MVDTGIDNQAGEKRMCLAKGGTWDGTKCIMPEKPVEDKTDPSRIKEGVKFEEPAPLKPEQTFNIGGQQVTKEEFQNVRRSIGGASGQLVTSEGIQSERVQGLKDSLDPAIAQQAALEQERARLTEEEAPVRRELDPEVIGLETVPIIGPIGTKILDLLPFKGREDTTLTPDELRTEALTEIEKQETERGLTLNEEFGAWVESIPVVGGLVSKYAGGLIETPSSNTREVVSNVRKERRRISNIETNVKLGYLPISVAQEQISDIEQNVQRLESRIRLLVSESPELKFNSDGVNTIETEILTTREKIFQAKQNILTGATADPTELALLQQLQLTEGDLE